MSKIKTNNKNENLTPFDIGQIGKRAFRMSHDIRAPYT